MASQAFCRTSESRVAMFARHETFPPRFGWLKKGFDRASENPRVFLADDATVILGVGKNMVRAIRYWCAAFKLLENDEPTRFGEQLLGSGGWDSYLEDPASLWLLHWQLLQAPCLATAWHFAFNEFGAVEFTEEQMRIELENYTKQRAYRVAATSLKKDVACLLRMYLPQLPTRQQKNSEESLDCPFADLGLLRRVGDRHLFGFCVGDKPSLPPAVVAYASLQQAANSGGSTIPFSKLLFEPGSPGLVFKLTEAALHSAITAIAQDWRELTIVETAGRLQFSFTTDPRSLAETILNSYYASN